MYKISEFAYLCGATTKTLRFYDSIGLLKADYIDLRNGYRYYSDNKIQLFYKIASLKQLGFTLEEIRDSLIDADAETILKLLKQKERVLYNAYRNCQKIISIYEERLKMFNESKNARVKISLDESEGSITLCDDEASAKIYCLRDELYDCGNVFNDMLNTGNSGVPAFDAAEIFAIIGEKRHASVSIGFTTGKDGIYDAVEQAFGDMPEAKVLVFLCEISKGVRLEDIVKISEEAAKRINIKATMVWAASPIDDMEEYLRITAIKLY